LSNFQIIVAILSISFLAALLTSVVNYRITNLNYRNEYYKKILDKRLQAYEKVYSFICNLKMMVHDTDESTLSPFLLSNGIAEFEKQTILLLVPIRDNIWLSDELSAELTQTNLYLHSLLNEINDAENPEKALAKIANDKLEEIRVRRNRVQLQMSKDLKDMHNIKRFLKFEHE